MSDDSTLKHRAHVSEVRVQLPEQVVSDVDEGRLTKEMLEEAVWQMAQSVAPPQHFNARCSTIPVMPQPEPSEERQARMTKYLDRQLRRNRLLKVVWDAVNELLVDNLVEGDMHGTGHSSQRQGLDIKLRWETPNEIVHPSAYSGIDKEHAIGLTCAMCGSTFVEEYATENASVHRQAQAIIDPTVVVCEACASK